MDVTNEKASSTVSSLPVRTRPSNFTFKGHWRGLCTLLFFAGYVLVSHGPVHLDRLFLRKPGHDSSQCYQASELIPATNAEVWTGMGSTIDTEAFKTQAINWLAGAVRVPTESYDKMEPVGVDPRWEAFAPFHAYLLSAFPLVHESLTLTKVNTYGLWYEWTGSDSSRKPLLLAAHQDVVPVEPNTVKEWVHPPYSGYFDGQRLWGRGSTDDKSGLIGILSTIETLLEKGFKPSRTVVLSFGFDEEASGVYGAGYLSKALTEHYGEGAFAMIVDEGGLHIHNPPNQLGLTDAYCCTVGFMESYGSVFATPGIAEKGYLDVKVDVSAAGGHSSIPPSHTSIGVLAALLVEYESNPYKTHLHHSSPVFATLQCYAKYAKDLPGSLRKTIKRATDSKKAMTALEKILFSDNMWESLVGTTQAITLTQGGVKSNALPEKAWAVVNHRISTESSVSETMEHDTALLKGLAKKFNLTYTAFGENIIQADNSKGSLSLSDAWGTALEPAPKTPTDRNAAPFALLSGTIKATYNAHRSITGDNIVVGPGIMSGNTDTRYYWKLSDHIFRYGHHNQGSSKNLLSGVHTVNESIDVDSFLEIIRFFATLILNADEAVSL
ncbi:hypothetical protein ONZ45_g1729 [Pleurotus djamor]|nr:hypothetical protein ONZ45_g1729 [Pleurotus djamor]